MTQRSDDDLYARGAATLVASWEQFAHGAEGAMLVRRPGVAAAVFPEGPERGVFNNALLTRDLGPAERASALDAMEAAYSDAGVERFAAWVHESDEAMRRDVLSRGYTFEESTRAMGMCLDGVSAPTSELEFGPADWAESLSVLGLPDGLLSGVDPHAFRVLVARMGGTGVATAMAHDHGGDCGVYNVTTLESARRRGLGRALTARLVGDAMQRGCATASLQSTEMAEGVYAAVGFRDLGRILEFVPGRRQNQM
jgi:ribosomal protein S18 acetylase RimI-like enzyme